MSYAIPSVQRAFVLPRVGAPPKFVTDHPVVPPNELLPGQCLVNLSHSGVCHSDVAIKEGWFASRAQTKLDLVGGHEGIGTVVAIAEHTRNSPVKIGDRVGVMFLADTCQSCEYCLSGAECFCVQMKKAGNTFDGTFSEYTVAYVDHVTPIPDNLDSADAAPIMCAGFTVYSALRQCEAHVGNWVVISGAGGGLGHLGVQYAVSMGLRVVAIDTGEEKRKLVLELGAEKWIDFKETQDLVSEVVTTTGGGAHAAVITAGGNAVYNQAVEYLRPRGRLLAVGLPRDGMLSIPIILLAARGLTIRGVFIGNRQIAKEAVELAALGKVKCRYSLRGLSELEQVYSDLEDGNIVGRVVLDINK
ncbi:mannitol-1-phosphate dehydrogenase MPDH1 [Fomitiporia mediterranea MF3/22]|uniref:mannitol-1-phosphate dehydrogenase MPDH1 n=1 Tax=Fomitiporia mediterranea (strain MF3/22) TaxID=694068 RepID=UPI000440911E|nr:mannitol-1-phosphate dehydrogenase MPDH1 [Fomitiporia mediterranea MF3/22]EJD05633.1 mannitol-1-phosphate dehydrogenase MPDH1 [Fomitiporia mediterranea MF3/22]